MNNQNKLFHGKKGEEDEEKKHKYYQSCSFRVCGVFVMKDNVWSARHKSSHRMH